MKKYVKIPYPLRLIFTWYVGVNTFTKGLAQTIRLDIHPYIIVFFNVVIAVTIGHLLFQFLKSLRMEEE
jgi:hypothetical protein